MRWAMLWERTHRRPSGTPPVARPALGMMRLIMALLEVAAHAAEQEQRHECEHQAQQRRLAHTHSPDQTDETHTHSPDQN